MAKKAQAANASRRKAAKGATRKREAVARERTGLAGWLNRLLLVAGAAVVLVAAGQGYLYLQSIPVQQIRVSGELEYTRAEAIQEIVHPALAGGFLGADLNLIREEVERLPWVYRVSVRRRWPAALELHVTEQLAIARWGDGAFLNHSGEIFESNRVPDQQALPLLQGPDGTAPALTAQYMRLTAMLEPADLRLESLHLDPRGHLEAGLAGGVRVILGNRDVRERMQRFIAVYSEHLAARHEQLVRVDLRYESGLAVVFKPSAIEPAAEPEESPSRVAGL